VLYFAWVREKVGLSEETVTPPPEVKTVDDLVDWLAQRSAGHAAAFTNRKSVKAAVDQVHTAGSGSVAGAKEVAFFPPMTGG
jgi:molybdopterin synthase sulfur carrier subunit